MMPEIYRARAMLLGKAIVHTDIHGASDHCTKCGYSLADVPFEDAAAAVIVRGAFYEIRAALVFAAEISCADLVCVAGEQISGTMPPEASDDESPARGAA